MNFQEKKKPSAFRHCTVIKYGGHIMAGAELAFAEQVVSLYRKGIAAVIVHGGGPEITEMLNRLAIPSEFINGLRKTSAESLEIVQMVLCGAINKRVASLITSAGAPALGLSGTDCGLIKAKPLETALGFVGTPETVNIAPLQTLLEGGIIPVVAPIGVDSSGQNYNINSDTAAAALAGALGTSLFVLTNVSGVLDENGQCLHELRELEIETLFRKNVIHNGMMPKVQAGLEALKAGASEAIILDGRDPENIERVLLAKEENIGTRIRLT